MLAAACTEASGQTGATPTGTAGPSGSPSPGPDQTKLEQAKEHLKHLVFIVQENRSFDHYFGTFPGADGIPMRNGKPTVCVPDPIAHKCVKPYHTTSQLQEGGPHGQRHSELDVDGGKMDGFVETVIDSPLYCADHRSDPKCDSYLGPQGQPDVMSYHTAKEIPNYWRYAKEFVLQDHMFAPADSWTLPAHLFLVSAWAAHCSDPRDPMSCASDLYLNDEFLTMRAHEDVPIWAWTDITYVLHEQGVSWGYYVGDDTVPTLARVMPREHGRSRTHSHGSRRSARRVRWIGSRRTPSSTSKPRTGTCRRSRGSCRTTGWGSTPPRARRSGRGSATSRTS
jgi:phospholipase C